MKTHDWQSFLLALAVCTLIIGMPLLSSAQIPLKSDGPVSRKIIPRPRNQINIEAWFDKPCGAAYVRGEKITINFRTTADGYVTVYDIDTSGQVSILFPNSNFPDNFVKADQIYSMPDPSYTYDLLVDGPEGIEYMDFVASSDSYYH